MAIRMKSDMDSIKRKSEEKAKAALIFKLKLVGESCVTKARNLPNPPASMLAVHGSPEYDSFEQPYYRHQKGSKTYKIRKGHLPNYFDWSFNLRSSISFVIVDNGNIVFSDFENKGGDEGVEAAKNLTSQLVNNFPNGISLIFVAGMKYAAYVQRKGYDVTASAELLAEEMIKQMQLNATLTHL